MDPETVKSLKKKRSKKKRTKQLSSQELSGEMTPFEKREQQTHQFKNQLNVQKPYF